jgi:hypothetical protein
MTAVSGKRGSGAPPADSSTGNRSGIALGRSAPAHGCRHLAGGSAGRTTAAVSVGYVTPDVMGMLGDPLDESLINEVR